MAGEFHAKCVLGEFVVDPEKYLLKRNNEHVHLPELPFQVLLFLVDKRERYVSRQELLDRFWSGSEGYEETLTKCVSTIRTHLNDPPTAPRYIETRKKVGYRYIGPFEALTEEKFMGALLESEIVEKTRFVEVVVEEEDERPALRDTQTIRQIARNPTQNRRLMVAVVTSIALILIVGGVFLSRRATSSQSAAAKPINSIAVLPLKNLTGDPSKDYFSDGMSESLINSLSKMGDLKVVARSSVFRFKNVEVDPRELGRQLGVSALVEGSVKHLDDSVQVSVRLVNVEDGRVLWASDERERAFGNLFALQDEIARDIAINVRGQLTGEFERRLAKRYTENTEAYQLYLQGRYYVNNFSTSDDLTRAVGYFDEAIARDPKYALAYAGLADTYITMATDWRRPREVFPKALEYAEKALELDANLGEAHYSRGAIAYFYEWDWEKASKELDTSLDLDAKSVEGNACYLHAKETLGRPADALAQIRRAFDRNPLSVMISSELGCASYYARDYDRALTFDTDTLAMDQGFAFAHYNAARALGQKKQFDRALSEMDKVLAVWGRSAMTLTETAYLYAMQGKTSEAQTILSELNERSNRDFVDPYPVAFIYVALGDNDRALTSLEKAYAIRSTWMPWINLEPKFDQLRSNPRFIDLLKRLKIQSGSAL
jgi:TolB-like protein/DNA-binding winged helix-turn-helix (wHTH) protein/Tfp pilus assembly protein PilF